jgi:outer membrane protein TolC
MGEFNLLQLITTQDKVIKSRREFLDAQLAHWNAVFDLEQALGARLSDIRTNFENIGRHPSY